MRLPEFLRRFRFLAFLYDLTISTMIVIARFVCCLPYGGRRRRRALRMLRDFRETFLLAMDCLRSSAMPTEGV
uniref:Putative secreted peptide n=1 Tax=Anopheles braziliensis TaxID=58242 RepID=A0A2M3ZW56_9DIPT